MRADTGAHFDPALISLLGLIVVYLGCRGRCLKNQGLKCKHSSKRSSAITAGAPSRLS